MKILGIILSFYFLGLNFMPCTDGADNSSSKNDVEIASEVSETPSEHHHTADLCPPFCQCHCCHVHTTYFSTNFQILTPEVATATFSDFEEHERDFKPSLLQPPRV